MNWFDALQAFVKVAEKKSFVGAAKALRIPTSKVTKLVQWLEHQLKTVLLVRTTRQVSLTESGENLFQRASNLLEEWNALHTCIIDQERTPSGLLTVAALPDILTTPPFIDWLMQFTNQYPDIRLHLTTIHHAFALSHHDADVFIGRERYVLDTADVISKKLLDFNFGIYASPEYVKTHKKIQSPADLDEHNCLIYMDQNEWEFTTGKQTVCGKYTADSSSMLLAAATAGVGVVRAPDFRANCYVKQNKLQSVLEEYILKSDPVSCNIYYKKLPYQPRKIKLFVEHMAKKAMLPS